MKPKQNNQNNMPSFVPSWAVPIVQSASQKYNIPTAILASLIQQESGYNTNAVSPAGAQGIAQFMPGTAQSYGIDPFNPSQAIEGAAQYLRNSLDTFGGDIPKALASYNAGIGAVQKYNGIPPYAETQNYVQSIMSMAGQQYNPQQSVGTPLGQGQIRGQVGQSSVNGQGGNLTDQLKQALAPYLAQQQQQTAQSQKLAALQSENTTMPQINQGQQQQQAPITSMQNTPVAIPVNPSAYPTSMGNTQQQTQQQQPQQSNPNPLLNTKVGGGLLG